MFLDTCLLGLLALAIFKGMRKGMVVAAFSFFGVIVGLAAAVKMSALIANWLSGTLDVTARWLPFLAFAIIMVAVSITVRIGVKVVETALQYSMLGWVNKLGGVLLYVLLYFSVFSIVVFYLEKLHLLNTATIQSANWYPYIQFLGPKSLQFLGDLIPLFKDMFEDLSRFFDGLSDKLAQ